MCEPLARDRRAGLSANAILSQFWFTFQTFLFPWLEKELGPLAERHRALVRVLELVRVERWLPRCGGCAAGNGSTGFPARRPSRGRSRSAPRASCRHACTRRWCGRTWKGPWWGILHGIRPRSRCASGGSGRRARSRRGPRRRRRSPGASQRRGRRQTEERAGRGASGRQSGQPPSRQGPGRAVWKGSVR